MPHMVDLMVQLDTQTRRPRPSTRSARSTCRAPYVAPVWASSGTSSSPATTISAPPLWSAPKCAMLFTPATVDPSACLASAPPPGSSPRETASSDGHCRRVRRPPPFVVDNRSFLMLPWIVIPNLGPHILAIVRRRLPEDRTEHHNTTPVLIKTFVETPRHRSRLQSIRLDPCRGHLRMRMRALPPANGVRQAQERRLTLYSAYSAKRLEVNRE